MDNDFLQSNEVPLQPRRRRTRAATASVAIIAALTAGIGVTIGTGEANAAAPAGDRLARYHQQKPVWKRCDAEQPVEFQCATIKVPLDYKRPAGPTMDVAISRIKTSVPGKRRGVLLFNPGGPGGTGLDMPRYMKAELPKAVQEQYDLIGFDPRGLGESSPITCGLTGDDGSWLNPYKPETFAKDVARSRRVANKCAAKAGDKIPYVTTPNTARDMDVIRAVLGEKKLSYLGYSYGTHLGAVYTQLFPNQSDRIVLDSAVDPALAWRGMVQAWAVGSKPAFARWTKWTAERSKTYALGDTPAKVKKTFWDLVAQANQKPIELWDSKWDGDAIRSAARFAVFTPVEAAELVSELKKAASGAPTTPPVQQPAITRFKAAAAPADNADAVFWSVVCGDASNWPRDPEQYRRDAIRDKVRYPLAGDSTSNIMPCAFWKAKRAEPDTVVNNKVASLVVQNEWDSQTPLFTGLGMHRALKGSRLVYVEEGEGHGVYGSGGNKCAYDAVNAYLITGSLPAKNVTCQATGQDGSSAKNSLKSAAPFPVVLDRF
jgi:pimeloyl-ACP methyl ester carboxylesterase